jgi:pimeloyl-ACP methyl ester carboxylesterase
LYRWFAERMDDAMLPLLKLLSPGYRRRLPSYREASACEIAPLGALAAPEAVSIMGETDWRGFRMYRYQFESPVQCQCDHNRSVSGRLIETESNAPWLVVVPGYSTGAIWPHNYSFFQDVQGLAALQRGLNVALIDLPFHLSRKPPGRLSGEGFFSPDLEETQQAFRQAAADTIALVRWLQERSGRPVGLWGTSLGGCVAGLAATQLADLSAVVLMEPLDNPGDVLASLAGTREIREELARSGLLPEQIPERLQSVAPSSYPSAVPPERLLFITPQWDRVVPTRFQEAFWTAWGKPDRILVPATHTTTAANRTVCAAAAEFLAGHMRQDH